ncbi:MATE family efflux transporter [Croceicoccus naphthovorans]|uniref:Multidrug-efflux transporter n=1 Tax=Croceicoccus naphthovorans TaxID=1348774 RepID=A0A0G3XHG9_9SPHN|nr:MATE family efflux transporter [Croceicoccus naphthovorans]AKM11015.1 multidrug transporter [Croceicoccus naphthovorans]MBB3989565.1 MATE family multidrug resistance protein [Croceicoccus naphthovorans]
MSDAGHILTRSNSRFGHPEQTLRAEFGATARLAVPLAAANLLQMAVYTVDVLFIARIGTQELAASTLAVSSYGLMLWCTMGLISAVAPMAATALGRGRHAVREVRRSFRMALWLSVLAGLFVMVGSNLAEPFMLLTGQSPQIAAMAGEYLRWLSPAAIPVLAAAALRIFVSTMDRAVIATWVTVLALIVNFIGNWLLIFGNWGFPALGLKGAAIASVITSLAVLAAYIAIIQSDRRMRRHYLFGRLWRPDWQRLRELWRVGLPIGAITLAEGGLFSGAAYLMGAIGMLELAAHTVALQLGALAFQVPMGIGTAATIRVGLHNGAGSREGIHRAGLAVVSVAMCFAGVFAVAMIGMPKVLLSLFFDVDAPVNANVVALATTYLVVAAAFQLFDGAQAVLAGLLRGLSDTRVPFILAVIGYWLFGFGTAYILGFHTSFGGLGVWIGLAVGLIVTSILLGWRWHRRESLGLVMATA